MYVGLNIYILVNHVNWRDEAQSWLLAKELSPIELFRQMKYEGHPCMWHLVLMPFAKLGFPYITMNIISLSVMTISAWLFLRYSNFNVLWQAMILFSSNFVLFYPVVSRSYCLAALIICLLAMFYSKRHEKPYIYGLLLALMVQTHIVMLPMAGVMSVFWLVEAILNYKKNRESTYLKRQALGLTMPLVSLIILLLQIMGATSSSAFNVTGRSLSQLISKTVTTFFRIMSDSEMFAFRAAMTVLFVAVLAVIFVQSIKKKDYESIKVMAIAMISVFAQIVFYIFMYSINMQRYILIRFILIWMFWVLFANRKINSKVLIGVVVCVLLLLNGNFYLKEFPNHVKVSYSDSKKCAEFIDKNIPSDAPVIVNYAPPTSAILPYSDRDFFYSMENGERFSFVSWERYDEAEKVSTYSQLCNWAKTKVPEYDHVYLIMTVDEYSGNQSDIDDSIKEFYSEENLLYKTSEQTLTDEAYVILKLPVK